MSLLDSTAFDPNAHEPAIVRVEPRVICRGRDRKVQCIRLPERLSPDIEKVLEGIGPADGRPHVDNGICGVSAWCLLREYWIVPVYPFIVILVCLPDAASYANIYG